MNTTRNQTTAHKTIDTQTFIDMDDTCILALNEDANQDLLRVLEANLAIVSTLKEGAVKSALDAFLDGIATPPRPRLRVNNEFSLLTSPITQTESIKENDEVAMDTDTLPLTPPPPIISTTTHRSQLSKTEPEFTLTSASTEYHSDDSSVQPDDDFFTDLLPSEEIKKENGKASDEAPSIKKRKTEEFQRSGEITEPLEMPSCSKYSQRNELLDVGFRVDSVKSKFLLDEFEQINEETSLVVENVDEILENLTHKQRKERAMKRAKDVLNLIQESSKDNSSIFAFVPTVRKLPTRHENSSPLYKVNSVSYKINSPRSEFKMNTARNQTTAQDEDEVEEETHIVDYDMPLSKTPHKTIDTKTFTDTDDTCILPNSNGITTEDANQDLHKVLEANLAIASTLKEGAVKSALNAFLDFIATPPRPRLRGKNEFSLITSPTTQKETIKANDEVAFYTDTLPPTPPPPVLSTATDSIGEGILKQQLSKTEPEFTITSAPTEYHSDDSSLKPDDDFFKDLLPSEKIKEENGEASDDSSQQPDDDFFKDLLPSEEIKEENGQASDEAPSSKKRKPEDFQRSGEITKPPEMPSCSKYSQHNEMLDVGFRVDSVNSEFPLDKFEQINEEPSLLVENVEEILKNLTPKQRKERAIKRAKDVHKHIQESFKDNSSIFSFDSSVRKLPTSHENLSRFNLARQKLLNTIKIPDKLKKVHQQQEDDDFFKNLLPSEKIKQENSEASDDSSQQPDDDFFKDLLPSEEIKEENGQPSDEAPSSKKRKPEEFQRSGEITKPPEMPSCSKYGQHNEMLDVGVRVDSVNSEFPLDKFKQINEEPSLLVENVEEILKNLTPKQRKERAIKRAKDVHKHIQESFKDNSSIFSFDSSVRKLPTSHENLSRFNLARQKLLNTIKIPDKLKKVHQQQEDDDFFKNLLPSEKIKQENSEASDDSSQQPDDDFFKDLLPSEEIKEENGQPLDEAPSSKKRKPEEFQRSGEITKPPEMPSCSKYSQHNEMLDVGVRVDSVNSEFPLDKFKQINEEPSLLVENVEEILKNLTPKQRKERAIKRAKDVHKHIQESFKDNSSIFSFDSSVRKLPTSHENLSRFNLARQKLLNTIKIPDKLKKVHQQQKEEIVESSSSLYSNGMRQTGDTKELPWKSKSYEIGVQVKPEVFSIGTQTLETQSSTDYIHKDYVAPINIITRDLNKKKLMAIRAFAELINLPNSNTNAVEMYKRQMQLIDIYKMSQLPSALATQQTQCANNYSTTTRNFLLTRRPTNGGQNQSQLLK